MTVNEHETRAVHDAFLEATGIEGVRVSLEGRLYHNLGTINGTTVYHALSEMGSGSVGAMQQTVDKAIRALAPGAVIAIGIAFGVNKKKQSIGHVLVSRQLRLYDLQRSGKEINLRDDKPHATPRLINHFGLFAQTGWKGVAIKQGVILTGARLIDSIDYRDQLIQLEVEAIGGEMEGAGLYVSSHEHKVDWIVIKAICDWADGSKGYKKDERQKQAAKNAAEFLIASLKYAPLKRLDIRREEPTRSLSVPQQESVGNAAGQEFSAQITQLRSVRGMRLGLVTRRKGLALIAGLGVASVGYIYWPWSNRLPELAPLIDKVISEIEVHLRAEIGKYRAPPPDLPGYDAMAVAQMALALDHALPIKSEDLVEYFKGQIKFLFHPTAIGHIHTGALCWVGCCLTQLRQMSGSATPLIIHACDMLIENQHPDGCWSIFLDASRLKVNGSTFSTCWTNILLQTAVKNEVLSGKRAEAAENANRKAIEWIKRYRTNGALSWSEYPEASARASTGLDAENRARVTRSVSGLVIFCAHETGMNFEQSLYDHFLDSMPTDFPLPTSAGQSDNWISIPGGQAPGVRDTFFHHELPWMLVALSRMPLPSRSQSEKVQNMLVHRLQKWQDFVRDATSRTWVAAETLFALKKFRKHIIGSDANLP